jgi:hypothetical protein
MADTTASATTGSPPDPHAAARRLVTPQRLGGALRALEVNPLWVNRDQVEALDVLVVTEPDGSSGAE